MIRSKGSSATKGIRGFLIQPGNCYDFNDSSFCNVSVIDSLCNFKECKGCTKKVFENNSSHMHNINKNGMYCLLVLH